MNKTRKNNRTRINKNHKTHNKTKKRVFTEDDYNSGDGFLTSIFGPAQWHFLHTMSFNYPVNPTAKDKKNYRNYIYNLRYVLPCKYCRINLTNNLKKKPMMACHLANREAFSRYVYELHELVNKMLGKNSHLSYEDVRERYEHFRSRCTEEKPKVFKFKKSATKTKKKREKGCTEPLYGKKSKCVINIVPQEDKSATFQIKKECIKTRE